MSSPSTAPMEEVESQPSASSRQRPRTSHNPGRPEQESGHWTQSVLESAWYHEESSYWTDHAQALEVELEMPDSRRGWEKALHDLPAFFTGALRRQAVEVSERRLTPSEYASFQQAKQTEVKNFLAAKAFEALPPELRPSRDQAIAMRWIVEDQGRRRTPPQGTCRATGVYGPPVRAQGNGSPSDVTSNPPASPTTFRQPEVEGSKRRRVRSLPSRKGVS